jgi:hypothetical protein
MKSLLVLLAVVTLLAGQPQRAAAQAATRPFEMGVQLVTAWSSQFDETDSGGGLRVGRRVLPWIGFEGELNLFPAGLGDRVPFSDARQEGLFGVTVGPAFARVRPFARLRGGFLRFAPAPEPIACILIYPPPLACVLAEGRTLPAFDFGGGAEVSVTPRTFLRLDAGDRIVRYPTSPVDLVLPNRRRPASSHDFRLAVGAGVRF